MKKHVLVKALFFSMLCSAQVGVSTGSVGMIKSNGLNSRNEMGELNDRMIVVEDFMNYHKHHISVPVYDKVQLSMDYSNSIFGNNEFLLQVGLATQERKERKAGENNVNATIVLDRSGSMSSENKLNTAKKAIKKFVEGLSDEDYFSLVCFDDEAQVYIPATVVGKNRTNIYSTIENITDGGSTNLNDGMMLGYNETEKHNTKGYNSRLIILTDGMTNSGETDQEKILLNSKNYNDKGIEISTVGVGNSLDFDLLKKLAENGRGSNHFVGSNEEDIQKVFVSELQSLLFQVGKNPEVTIELPEGMEIKEFYGYNPIFIASNKVKVNIENLNAGTTQIFLMKVKSNTTNEKIKATLKYQNNGVQETNILTQYSSQNPSTNSELSKNYQIAYMATQLKVAAQEYQKNNMGNYNTTIREILNYIDAQGNTKDTDINRLYSIFSKLKPVASSSYSLIN